jgi:hypothetical protein
MKLVYHVKFRANFGLFKATLGSVEGTIDLDKVIKSADVLTAIAGYMEEHGINMIVLSGQGERIDKYELPLVNERGVYIALNLE